MVILGQSVEGWVKNQIMSKNSQFLVILLIKVFTLKLNYSNFHQFSPESI